LLTAFDLLLIAIAIVIMAAGFKIRWAVLQLGRKKPQSRDLQGLVKYLLGHDKILQSRYTGLAHLAVFFGFLIPIVIIILAQFDFAIPLPFARLLSLLTDLLGLAMAVGLVFFLLRRIRSTTVQPSPRTVFPVVVLLIILITGFLAEATRLSIGPPGFSWSSPVGWLISPALPESPLVMQMLIRIHFLAVLLFVATLPFTFMRHLVASSLSVYYRRQGLPGEMTPVSLDCGPTGAKTIQDFTRKQLLEAEACVACGRCEENCPASMAQKPLSPRKVMQDILGQMEQVNRNGNGLPSAGLPLLEKAVTADEIWSCTSCMACVVHCPVFIEPLDKIIDLRRYKVMGQGLLPVEARSMIRDLELYRDVFGRGISHRTDWALNRDVPLISEDPAKVDVLFWVGCSGAFHPRYRHAAQEMVRILRAAAINFAILGKSEYCCGDPARRLGDESLFFELAHKNIRQLNRHGVPRILTLCPHCYNTLKNEYPSLGADFEVEHASQFIARLIVQKHIQLQYPLEKTLTVHDPCYLGRANQVYEPLRQICRAVPGLRFKELQRNRESAFCCGGGGGKMWLHDSAGRHINQLRAEEITQSGVDLVATACPYCVTMLEDGIAALEIEKPPKVKDIVEVVASSLAV
jgi:Fe-S oxidoreductase/nitrate reductase gamma subunit